VANEQNLIPNSERTPEQLREQTRKGGIRSGEVRREKASFKNAIKWLIESDIKIDKGNLYESFKKSGIDISKLNTTQLATLGLWSGAVQGNATNYKTLMEANEEIQTDTETPSININIVDNSNLEKVMYSENEDNNTEDTTDNK
jgi:hypothetical protein